MDEKIVSNASPLIALGKMQAFDFIAQLPYNFLCPDQVALEVTNGAASGYAVTVPDWVTVWALQTPLTPFASLALDDGEAAVIQLALEQNITKVCIDELKGRRAALGVSLQVVGSLGLFGKAKTAGLISAARPFIEQAQQGGVFLRRTTGCRLFAGTRRMNSGLPLKMQEKSLPMQSNRQL
jgi:predicted nucleic acid-binding protein